MFFSSCEAGQIIHRVPARAAYQRARSEKIQDGECGIQERYESLLYNIEHKDGIHLMITRI